MLRIIGIYNANGGVMGELAYVFGKIFKQTHCALCDISHGYSIKGKKEWWELTKSFPIYIEALHLNEVDQHVLDFINKQAPCVVLENNGELVKLMEAEDLEACGKSPKVFFRVLKEKLEENNISVE